MRRLAIAAAFAVTVTGCVKTHLQSQDFQTGTIVICGNRNATFEDLNTNAGEVCRAPPKVLRCAEQAYGSRTYVSGGPYGAVATTRTLTGNCCEYQCPR